MLERYFKTKQDFDKYLDKTYDPDTFEKSFEQFLNSLVSSSYTLDIKVNNFNNNEDITNNTSLDMAGYSILALKYLKEHKKELEDGKNDWCK